MSDLIEKAKKILENKTVEYIIGYTDGIKNTLKPFIARNSVDAEKLRFSYKAVNNLSVYLTRLAIPEGKKIGIIAKGCDIRSIVALIQENKITRSDVFILTSKCAGVSYKEAKDGEINTPQKCEQCLVKEPKHYDLLFENDADKDLTVANNIGMVIDLESMNTQQRWDYWQEEFEKCVKCYACRQACPLCYCEQCITDKTTPRWITSQADTKGNFGWNVIRAFHLSGRCTGCNECERACPAEIPLGLLNKKMGMFVKEKFNYSHGVEPDQATLIGSYSNDDKEDFIK